MREHLENEHQQLANDENVIEIVLLNSSQSVNFLSDNKNDKSLVEAKNRMSVIRNTSYDDIEQIYSDDDENAQRITQLVDLTLDSDDDI